MSVKRIMEVLRTTTHNGFPVFADDSEEPEDVITALDHDDESPPKPPPPYTPPTITHAASTQSACSLVVRT